MGIDDERGSGPLPDAAGAEVTTAGELLSRDLRIPDYQRPYRWTARNIVELLEDIDGAVAHRRDDAGFRYRIGTVILHRNVEGGTLDIVDGQQRAVSLLLFRMCLAEAVGLPVPDFPLLASATFSSRESRANIRANHELMVEWLRSRSEEWCETAVEAFERTLEAVVITVDRVEEAFQLFDSQNTRGRSLDPHDLLKAYHLRAMRDDPYEMRHAVTRWEEFPSGEVRDLFARFLFPAANWSLGEKTRPFTSREIDAFKGVPADSGYTFAARARRAAPCFQIGASFVEGGDFFSMAERYLRMRRDIECELSSNRRFEDMWGILGGKRRSAGFHYAAGLFRCVLMAYYDRFHNFDERAVRKLFAWAFMLRVDMRSLGFGSINRYAVGEGAGERVDGPYTNTIPMFSCIARARSHTEIANLRVEIRPRRGTDGLNAERQELVDYFIKERGL